MKCEKCGADIPAGAKTCPKCNAAAPQNTVPQNKSVNTTDKNKSASAGKKNTNSNSNQKLTSSGKINTSGQAPSGTEDNEFDRQYSLMFESNQSNVGDADYEIDESLKKKREARYDDSFANMTDDEKIKALEAARLARKERREKKQAKRSGGIFSSFSGQDKENKTVKETVETGERSDSSAPFGQRSHKATGAAERKIERVQSSSDISTVSGSADKSAAVEKRPKRSSKRSKNFKVSPKTGLIAGVIVAVLVIAVVIASVNMASKVTAGVPATPTVYAKDNSLYSYYGGKSVEVSQNFIASEYTEPTEPTATPNRNRDDDEEDTPTAAPKFDAIKEKELINYTADGTLSFFLDNADLNNNTGSLQYTQNGKKNSTVKIADNVYYDIEIAEDGSGVLYLTDTDEFGAGGTLNFWSNISKKAVKLSDNVNIGNFRFGQNGNSALYITEYNGEYFVGDLYLAGITKGEVAEAKKIESDVYKVFGTNPTGKSVVYAKNYNTENECFEIYLKNDNLGEPVMVTDGSRIEPVFLKNSEGMYIGGTYEEYYQSLYYASLENGEKEKIAGGLTEIIKMSKDEQAVVFRKANAEGTAFDYFYANQAGTEGQLIAENVTVLDDEDHKKVSQFEINDDFTKAAFIQGYDLANESGALFFVSITNGVVGSDKKISDTAYSCNITPDGQTIRYADNYDIKWNLVTLNAYTGEQSKVLAQEVGAGAFSFDKTGSYIVYAKNYSLETRTGDVYCVDNKGKTVEVVKGVSSYGLKNNGEIVYYNKQDNGSNFELFFTREDGKKSKSIDKDVTKVVLY